MKLQSLLPKPCRGWISDAFLLEWLIALALTTSIPSMPAILEAHPKALNSLYLVQ